MEYLFEAMLILKAALEKLKAKGIELEEMGESIPIKKGGKTSMIMSNPNQAFLGVMMALRRCLACITMMTIMRSTPQA